MGIRATGVVVLLGACAISLTGCATTGRSDAEIACATSLVLGAIAGAVIDDDEKEGALKGLAVGALGCMVYRYLNDRQVAEMNSHTHNMLAQADPNETIDRQIMLPAYDGGSAAVFRLRAGAEVEASTLLDDEAIASTGVPEQTHCRSVSYTVRPSADAPDAVGRDAVRCLDENGDYVEVSGSTFRSI